MICCRIAPCRCVTFDETPDLRLIWFDDERAAGTCRVECFWQEFPIWMKSYKRQETFEATVRRHSRRVKQIALILAERMRHA